MQICKHSNIQIFNYAKFVNIQIFKHSNFKYANKEEGKVIEAFLCSALSGRLFSQGKPEALCLPARNYWSIVNPTWGGGGPKAPPRQVLNANNFFGKKSFGFCSGAT